MMHSSAPLQRSSSTPTISPSILLLLLHVVFVLLWSATAGLHYLTRVIGPTWEFDYPTEGRVTDDDDECGPSTDNIKDFTLDDATSTQEAGEMMGEHGVVVVPSILQKETAQAFRDYVMKANQDLPQIFVQEPENRYHISPPHTETVVQKVFNELAEHPKLRPLIDSLLGPESTLVIFSVVTNTYGAIDQNFHKDATGEADWPELFVPEYQLAIALQDVTEEMGATSIIPGTTGCEWPEMDWDEYEEYYNGDEAVQRTFGSFDNYLRAEGLGDVDVKATLNQGDGFIYHTATQHRGRGHTDPDAPDRVLVFFTFVGSRQGKDDTRMLPMGQVYALKWNLWGRTIEDMANLIKGHPWYFWQAFGIWNGRTGGVRPWNVVDHFFGVFRSSEELCCAFGEDFGRHNVERWQTELEWYMIPLTFLYMWLLLLIIVLQSVRNDVLQNVPRKKVDKVD